MYLPPRLLPQRNTTCTLVIAYNPPTHTVKREILVAIIFGGFENITIWLRFNLAISLKESGWLHIFFNWWLDLLILAKFIISPISPNKSSPIIYHFTVHCTLWCPLWFLNRWFLRFLHQRHEWLFHCQLWAVCTGTVHLFAVCLGPLLLTLGLLSTLVSINSATMRGRH